MSFTFDFTKHQLRQIIPQNQHLDHWFEALEKILGHFQTVLVFRRKMEGQRYPCCLTNPFKRFQLH